MALNERLSAGREVVEALEAALNRALMPAGPPRAIRESPLLPDSFAASGFVYAVRSGRLRELDA